MKTIENLNLTNAERGITVKGEDQVLIRNCWIRGTRIGIDITACKTVDIDNCDIGGVGTWGEWKYAYLLRSGFSGDNTLSNGIVRINNCLFHDIGKPSADYSKYNRDIITNEGGEIWAKDSKFLGASDACIDGKGSYKLKNCELAASHRLMRLWSGNVSIAVNCKFTSAPDHSIAWFFDKTAKLICYNCTFDGQKTIPLNKIEGEDMTPEVASRLVQYVNLDPLADNPWFGTAPAPEASVDSQILFHVKELARLLK